MYIQLSQPCWYITVIVCSLLYVLLLLDARLTPRKESVNCLSIANKWNEKGAIYLKDAGSRTFWVYLANQKCLAILPLPHSFWTFGKCFPKYQIQYQVTLKVMNQAEAQSCQVVLRVTVMPRSLVGSQKARSLISKHDQRGAGREAESELAQGRTCKSCISDGTQRNRRKDRVREQYEL